MHKNFKIIANEVVESVLSESVLTSELIESSIGSGLFADDGPSAFYSSPEGYRQESDRHANKLGWKVISFIMKDQNLKTKYRKDLAPITYFMKGSETAGDNTQHGKEDRRKSRYTLYKKHIQQIVTKLGWKLLELEKDEFDIGRS